MKKESPTASRAFLSGLLLVSAFVPLVRGHANQAGAAGSSAPALHVLQSATCCGFALTVDQTNLGSIQECTTGDTSCRQGIAVCFADGTCEDVAAGGVASVRYWKQYSAAGMPQRLDVVVAKISSHPAPTTTGWTQAQGAALP